MATAASSEEVKGPRSSAPPQALEGFLRKTGLTQDQLEDRDGVWFARLDKPGRATADVLAEAVATVVRDFQWPKSMRWGDRLGLDRQPALGPPAALDRRLAWRGDRRGRDRRGDLRRGDARPSLPPSRHHHHRRRARLCRKIARLPCPRRPGRARGDHPRRRHRSGRERRLPAGRGRRAGGRECRADRMASAAARLVRPRFSRRAARSHPAQRAHQPEIFRHARRRRPARAALHLHRQHRRQ